MLDLQEIGEGGLDLLWGRHDGGVCMMFVMIRRNVRQGVVFGKFKAQVLY